MHIFIFRYKRYACVFTQFCRSMKVLSIQAAPTSDLYTPQEQMLNTKVGECNQLSKQLTLVLRISYLYFRWAEKILEDNSRAQL